MKRRILLATLFILPAILNFAQKNQAGAIEGLMEQRSEASRSFRESLLIIDTNNPKIVDLAQKSAYLIRLDSTLIEQYLLPELDKNAGLQQELSEAKMENVSQEIRLNETFLYFLIAAAGAGILLLLFITFLILFLIKSGRAKKLVKRTTEAEVQIAGRDEQITQLEATHGEQTAKFKKDIDHLKASLEQERTEYSEKEEELARQVTLIEERMKKAGQKETDLNYQIFQLELRLKNELEATMEEKCRLENKVAELERELSDVKRRLEEESSRPGHDENEYNQMRERITWLENEERHLRQWAENEKQAREDLENIANEKQNETNGLYSERDSLWGRIHEMEGQAHDLNNRLNELVRQYDQLRNENTHLHEQLNHAHHNDEQLRTLNEKIGNMEQELAELRPQAEESQRLKEQLAELINIVDRFRS